MNKYGFENFEIEVLEEIDYNLLNERECFYIKKFKTTDKNYGYNMTDGGDGGFTLEKHPNKLEIYKKQAESRTGKKRSDEQKENMSIAQQGKIINLSKESRKKISETMKKRWENGVFSSISNRMRNQRGILHPNYGKTHTIETKEKISKSRKGKSWEDVVGVERAIKWRNDVKCSFSGNKNPLYKEVDIIEFMRLLDSGYTNINMSKILKLSEPTIITRCLNFTNMRPSEYRKIKKIDVINEPHYNYKEIDKEQFFFLLNKGCTNKEISKKLNIHLCTVAVKCREFCGFSPTEYRKQNNLYAMTPERKKFQKENMLGRKKMYKDGKFSYIKKEQVESHIKDGWKICVN